MEQCEEYYRNLLTEDRPEFMENTESDYEEIITNIKMSTKEEMRM